MRQQIRLESAELRELESKLNAAYMTKEREAQIREKEKTARAELEAELYRQAETERELEASHRFAYISSYRRNSNGTYTLVL